MKPALSLVAALSLSAQWILLERLGVHLSPPWSALLPGLAIFGAAFLLSWAAEVAQLDIPQALALAFLALIAVLPEYAVDMYFAWQGGKDPTYVQYATANMTGGNRLLLGLGWPLVLIAYWIKHRDSRIVVDPSQRIAIGALLAATIYSFVIPIKGTISAVDSFVLLSIYVVYIFLVSRTAHEEPELEGPSEFIARLPRYRRRLVTVGLFGLSGYAIYAAAQPFAEGLLKMGRSLGIEEFVLVQWLAPLASESPEFIVAILFALRAKASASFGTLLSSKVNQWTLLIGMLPLAFSLSAGQLHPMPLDPRQVEEVLLTAAQSLLGVVLLANLRFEIWDALILLALFATQLVVTNQTVRFAYAGVYVALAVLYIVASKPHRAGILGLFSRKCRRE